MVRQAGTAGNAVNQAFGLFQDAAQNSFGISHFPQHVHVNAAVSVGNLMSDLCLGDTALDGVFNHFFMAFCPVLSKSLNNDIAFAVIKIRTDAGESPHAVFSGPRAGAASVTAVNPFSTLD